jgi:hypothetical protein
MLESSIPLGEVVGFSMANLVVFGKESQHVLGVGSRPVQPRGRLKLGWPFFSAFVLGIVSGLSLLVIWVVQDSYFRSRVPGAVDWLNAHVSACELCLIFGVALIYLHTRRLLIYRRLHRKIVRLEL